MPPVIAPRLIFLLCFCSFGLVGCGSASKLTGRWFNKDISIRFRDNGTVLYNSESTGLVEGRYQYDSKKMMSAGTEPVKNLTVWLPQPGKTVVLEYELRMLGSDRVQLKPIRSRSGASPLRTLSQSVGAVLKRAEDGQDSNSLDKAPPLASATPGSEQ